MLKLEKIAVLQELKREGLSISAIARRTGLDRKTVRKLLDRGLAAPAYSPREPRPRLLEPYEAYLADKIGNCPDLSGRRLFREIRERGYEGGYTVVTAHLRAIRPDAAPRFERRFKTKPGEQAQADFAEFKTEFADEPGVRPESPSVLVRPRMQPMAAGRFCADQKLETVLRCHVSAFDACGGATKEVLYDRMKTAVLGEDADWSAVYNPSLVALLDHCGSAPESLQSLPGEDQGQGRATVPLHPPRLLPRPDLPQPRRPQRAIRRLARHGRQSARPRHHRTDRRPGLRRRARLFDPAARASPATPS